MPNFVNMDALIDREDFQYTSDGIDAPTKTAMPLTDLESDAFFYLALRKPDFQRETQEWDPDRVVGLIRTFINGDLIPGVILWRNKELLFVIDGSHRLSALIAWVQDDYGDGERSQKFFNYAIPPEQLKTAQKTRLLVEKAFGSYQNHRDAIVNPDAYGKDMVDRARRFASLALELQWVKGDFVKAESSFIRINQKAAMIDPQELELITTRRTPTTIAARAIIRKGTGHKYWKGFGEAEQTQVEALAADVHRLIFEPRLQPPVKSLDLPPGGSTHAAPALRMVYDFINLCVGTPSPEDDKTGERTLAYLTRCRRVMRLLLSNDPSSLGLHPAVYFYSWTGKQQPIYFLVVLGLVIEVEQSKRLSWFTDIRGSLESFLTSNRALVSQVVRKYGTKGAGHARLRGFYDDVLGLLSSGVAPDQVPSKLKDLPGYSYLQPAESPFEGSMPSKFSTQVRTGVVMRELLGTTKKCAHCGGLIPPQAITIDHTQRIADGGQSTVDNAQLMHPYCNTGAKERSAHLARRGAAQR